MPRGARESDTWPNGWQGERRVVLVQRVMRGKFPRMKPRRPLCLVMLLAPLACERPPAPPPYAAVADMRQLMASVVEPAAELYWDAVGSVDDSTGTTAIFPRSPDEWDIVRNSAYVVAESGNLLMMAPRALDQGEWMTLSRAMLDAGQRAIKAAEARDTSAVFNVGAELYETCTNCHARYAVGLLRPNAK